MTRFSQNLEQDYILEYFDKCNQSITPPRWILEGRKISFLDIGANSGKCLSNTWALAERGAVGCLIEPSPKAFAQLQENYKDRSGFYLYNVALGNHNSKAVLNESSSLLTSADVGLVSTFEQSEMNRFKNICTYEPVTVKMFKWKTFYNRLTLKTFDFINLDCEGFELHILPDMDLSKTSLICLEWNSKPDLKKEYEKYLDGFRLLYTSGENLLYGR